MTDLINKVQNLNVETVQALYHKYGVVLQEIPNRTENNLPYYAYIINVAYNYIDEKHKEETADWKAWCVVLIKRLFEADKLTSKEDVFNHIDQFLAHKKSEYENYVSNIAMYSDEYYRDSPFVEKYIKMPPL